MPSYLIDPDSWYLPESVEVRWTWRFVDDRQQILAEGIVGLPYDLDQINTDVLACIY